MVGQSYAVGHGHGMSEFVFSAMIPTDIVIGGWPGYQRQSDSIGAGMFVRDLG
jgi:hypothetical protein